jgi:hypothetical protein
VVENCEGEESKGTVNLTQGIHPEVVGVGACFGRGSRGEPLSKGKSLIGATSGHIAAYVRMKVGKADSNYRSQRSVAMLQTESRQY